MFVRWDTQRECYLDKDGNPVVDPKIVDFDAHVKSIPTSAGLYKTKKEEPKKKYVEEIIDLNQEMTTKNLKKMADKAMMAKQNKVETQTESTESSQKDKSRGKDGENGKKSELKNEVQCRKCMETFSACTEKEEILISRNTEITKIDDLIKERCKKLFC
ncbi:hypothetical protein Hanom_Chr10g00933801 [Helianthus anomalus]